MGSNVPNSGAPLKYSSNSVGRTKRSGGRRAAVASRDASGCKKGGEERKIRSPKDDKNERQDGWRGMLRDRDVFIRS